MVDQEACAQHHDGQRHGCKCRDWMAHGMLEIADEEKPDEVIACKMIIDRRKWLGRVAYGWERE